MFDEARGVGAGGGAARLLAQLLEFRLLLLLQHLLLLLQECVQLPLQLALLLDQRHHFQKLFIALLVDLDWLVIDRLGQFLLGERLVEVLPEF